MYHSSALNNHTLIGDMLSSAGLHHIACQLTEARRTNERLQHQIDHLMNQLAHYMAVAHDAQSLSIQVTALETERDQLREKLNEARRTNHHQSELLKRQTIQLTATCEIEVREWQPTQRGDLARYLQNVRTGQGELIAHNVEDGIWHTICKVGRKAEPPADETTDNIIQLEARTA